VYAAIDPPILDPDLGTAEEFKEFVDACHSANVRVFLDVIGHGLVNESHYITEHPEWFSGGSWGMIDYDYSSPGFREWWTGVWTDYALTYGVDGYRIDIADPSWWPVWNNITRVALAGGRELAVWGEGSRYHFSQHDFSSDTLDIANATPKGCVNTIQLSCHDSGWESPPGDYFYLRGSRAKFALQGALSPFIPLWLGGDEAWEDPVVDFPLLQEDLFGKSNKPGGWMYGSVRNWDALEDPNSPASQFAADVALLLKLSLENGDVLGHDTCTPGLGIAPLPISPSTTPLPVLAPYVRFNTETMHAVVLVGNTFAESVTYELTVPLEIMGFKGKGPFTARFVFGGDRAGNFTLSEKELSLLNVTVAGDNQKGGGASVLFITIT